MHHSPAWDRLGAVSGIFFAALAIIGVTMTHPPDAAEPGDVAGVIAIDFLRRRGELEGGGIILLIAVFFLIWFAAFLRHRLNAAEGENGWLAGVAYGGSLVAAAMLLMLASLALASGHLEDFKGDWQVAKTLRVVTSVHLTVLAPVLASLVGATAVAGIRTRALPAWVGWISLVFVLTPIIIAPALMTMIFLIWVLLLSVVLFFLTFQEGGPRAY